MLEAMKAVEFLEAYPYEVPTEHLHSEKIGGHIEGMRSTLDYSHVYGKALHIALGGGQPQDLPDLFNWAHRYEMSHIYSGTEETLFDAGDEAWSKYRSFMQFECLNSGMRLMWRPLFSDGQPDFNGKTPRGAKHAAMNALALFGTDYFGQRLRFVQEYGTEALYTKEEEKVLAMHTGLLQEIDVAIVALQAVLDEPDVTIVPAPIQFQAFSERAKVNFIAVNRRNHQAIGIQAMTSVYKEDRERYDPDRVVLIDGGIDLDNRLAVRTQRRSSKVQSKSWPGMVSAARTNSITARETASMPARDRMFILQQKATARGMLGKAKVRYPEFANRIRGRILEKLEV